MAFSYPKSTPQHYNGRSMAGIGNSVGETTMTGGVVVRKSKNIFPFLDLPAELRNRVYEYALVS